MTDAATGGVVDCPDDDYGEELDEAAVLIQDVAAIYLKKKKEERQQRDVERVASVANGSYDSRRPERR